MVSPFSRLLFPSVFSLQSINLSIYKSSGLLGSFTVLTGTQWV